jgi:hypothetical protein
VKKSLFVLASRQTISVLRTENPTVNTRTICLPPIEFLKITHARKAAAGKSRPKTTDTAGNSQRSGLWRETFYIPFAVKGQAKKFRQITTDTDGTSGCQ